MTEKDGQFRDPDYRVLYKSLNLRWIELCDLYLPLSEENSIWRYSRRAIADDPEQGWKIHVSATILTANSVLDTLGPLLRRRKILFKAPTSLKELSKINSGVYYGYMQVGKFLTIYPPSAQQAAILVRKLHKLMSGMAAPSVPFEDPYQSDSLVYYRYGSFKFRELIQPDGTRQLALLDSRGNMVPDYRDSPVKPEWVEDLFPSRRQKRNAIDTPLKSTYKAFRALSQRGRGGVYQALDLSNPSPRLCILKEGRRNGEVSLDGSDGYDRIKHEEHVLSLLRSARVAVPQTYSAFTAGNNYYLAMEYVDGENLEKWLGRRKKRLAMAQVLNIGIQLSRILSRIHAAGWVWRDCKLSNLLVSTAGALRPVDFEGACLAASPDPLPWGTPSFTPPEWKDEFQGQSRLPEDLYALGSILYLMVAGRLPDSTRFLPVEKLRPNVPPYLSSLIRLLLNADPERRPPAAQVARSLGEHSSRNNSTAGGRSSERKIKTIRQLGESGIGAQIVK